MATTSWFPKLRLSGPACQSVEDVELVLAELAAITTRENALDAELTKAVEHVKAGHNKQLVTPTGYAIATTLFGAACWAIGRRKKKAPATGPEPAAGLGPEAGPIAETLLQAIKPEHTTPPGDAPPTTNHTGRNDSRPYHGPVVQPDGSDRLVDER